MGHGHPVEKPYNKVKKCPPKILHTLMVMIVSH